MKRLAGRSPCLHRLESTWNPHAGARRPCAAAVALGVKRDVGRSPQPGEVPDQTWARVPGLAAPGCPTSGRQRVVVAKFEGGIITVSGRFCGSGLGASTGGLGWYYVHAEVSGARPEGRGHVTGTRGSHNDAALAS